MRGHTLRSFIKLMVFTAVTAVVTTVLAFTISNGSPGGYPKHYRAVFTDVTDLLNGDDIREAGVRIGQVTDIKVYQRKYALVTFGVERDVPVNESTHAAVRYRNLVGQRYIELTQQAGPDAPLPQNATIPLSRTAPALDLTALFNGFRPLFKALTPEDVNRLSMEIIKTLQGEGGTIDSLLASTSSLTNTIANRDAAVGAVIDNLDQVLAVVDARDQGLGQLISQLQRLVTGLAGDRDAIAASLSHIDDLASSTASLVKGIRPVLPTDLARLADVTHTLATTTNADGTNTLAELLGRLPGKINTITRTATYGSWFNFWLCDADAKVGNSITPVRTHVGGPECEPRS